MNRLLMILLLAFLVGGTPSSVLAEGMTPLDVANLSMVGGAEISPDGKYIAYLSMEARDLTDPDFENGAARRVLRLYNVATGADRVFIGWDERLRNPQWTADSQYLTFLSKREKDDKTSLYRIPVDGGEAQKVLSFAENIQGYSLAPNGRQLAFVAQKSKSAQDKKLEKLGFNQEVFEEDWTYSKLFVTELEADTKKLEPLPVEGHVSEVHWSPKAGSNDLLIVTAPNPGVDASLMYRRVHLMKSNGDVIGAIANPGKLGKVAWSPDGARVALTAGTDINDPDDGNLMVAEVSTRILKDLTAGMEGRADDFAWRSADELVVAMSFGVSSKLVGIKADGVKRDLAFGSSVNNRSVSVSRNGRTVTVADSPSYPSELFLDGKRLTDSNPWLKSKQLAKQEVITYEARDGLKIQGMLIRPLDGREPAPLIMVVHGGPEAHYDNGWLTAYSMPGQVGAAQGYAVFYPNYRGSTGRGQEFTRSSQGDPAGAEFDDLVDAIDHLVKIGVADPKKVGVTGGSYGGYATAWLSTRYTDRIAAGVMFVGISDKFSKVGTTDIADEEYLVHARKRPWDDFQFFLERSPINYVKQAKTPLLIMHGKDDPRVHPTQSMELYRFLQIIGETPVRLVLYPGEGHGNTKAAARYDYSLRLMRWFDHYLKGEGGEKPAYPVDYGLPHLETKGDSEQG